MEENSSQNPTRQLGAATNSVKPQSVIHVQKKVTLTNWKRLTNTEVQFDTEDAQALIWKDYVVVFSRRYSPKTLHLYHLKHGLWSQITANPRITMPKSGVGDALVRGLAFAIFDGDLIFLARNGKISKLISNKWYDCPDLKLPSLIDGGIPGIYTILVTASLIGDDMCNSLIVLEAQSEFSDSLQTLRYLQSDSQWSQPYRLQKSICCTSSHPHARFKFHTTFATVQGYLFISNGFQIFSLNVMSQSGKTIPVTEIALLPYCMFTIASVQDTLFAFGGIDEDEQPTSDVYCYNSSSNVWEPAGYMRNARYGIIVTPVQDETGVTDVIAIGGYFGRNGNVQVISRVTESCEVGTA